MPAGMLYTPLRVVGAGAARAQATLEPMGFPLLYAEHFLLGRLYDVILDSDFVHDNQRIHYCLASRCIVYL